MRESGQLLVGPEKVPRPEKGLKGGISWKLGSRRWRHLGEAEKIKSKCKIFFLERLESRLAVWATKIR